jgi:uncharacterized membrane protein YwzB
MYIYISVALLLIIVAIFMINSSRFDQFRDNNKRTFEFFISLISTFIGFFIAVSLNTVLGEINEKKNLVKILSATNLAIENSEMKTKGMYILPAKKGTDISEIITYAPVELPKLYSGLETNALINDYFSSNAFQAYILCSDNMETFVKNANATNQPSERKLIIMEKYLKYLGLAKQVNTLEIQRLNDEISEKEEEIELKKLTQQIINDK